jgi:Zn finger protein HypA/HybF involved in hydrogenase expression
MTNPDKRMHFWCDGCNTDFSTDKAVFPMDVKKLSKLVRETKCPNCGAGSKRLYLRANVKASDAP